MPDQSPQAETKHPPLELLQWARAIVDKTWNACTESEAVPSTSWADKIIDSVPLPKLNWPPPAQPAAGELPKWLTGLVDLSYDVEGEIRYSVNLHGEGAAGNPRFHLDMEVLKSELRAIRHKLSLTPASDEREVEIERLNARLAEVEWQKCDVDGYWYHATKLAKAELAAALEREKGLREALEGIADELERQSSIDRSEAERELVAPDTRRVLGAIASTKIFHSRKLRTLLTPSPATSPEPQEANHG